MQISALILTTALLFSPTCAQEQKDIAYPLDGWPPNKSHYSWLISNWKMGHVVHGYPFGWVFSTFNITGPKVSAPQPDPSIPPPTVVIPSFRASCQYDDHGADPHEWRPCKVDMDYAPTPPWKMNSTAWRLAVSLKAGIPGAEIESSIRATSVSLVFWSEYANQTWNMTAYFNPQWKATTGWWAPGAVAGVGTFGSGINAFPEKVERVLD